MSSRWKFGQVELRINPSAISNTVSQVGDNARTLSGAVISQPTGYVESYSMAGRVFQTNAKVLKEIATPNAHLIKYYKDNGRIYILNAFSSKIEEYSLNFTKIKDIPISTQAYLGYVGFDVYGNKFYLVSKSTETEEVVYELNMDGTFVKGTTNNTLAGKTIGYAFAGGSLWRNSSSLKIQKFDYSTGALAEKAHIHTPMIMSNMGAMDGYIGLTEIEERYLVTATNTGDSRAIYHMDGVTGNIASTFYIDNANYIHDIEQIGDKIILLSRDTETIQMVNANTALLDLHKIRREIEEFGYLFLEDDMYCQTRVSVLDYSINRVQGYEHMYEISMRVQYTTGGAL